MKKKLIWSFLSLTLFTTLSFGLVFPLLKYFPEEMDIVAMYLGYFLMGAISAWVCGKVVGEE